jgi:uncharacterized RDD family membrane protein YckC
VTVATPAAAGAEPDYAGIVSRGFALALDVAIVQASLFLIGAVITLIAEAFGDVSIDVSALEVLVGLTAWLIVFGAYLIGFWWLAGQTPGMRILGIEVRASDGKPVEPVRGLVRVGGMILAAIPLFAGYLPILYSERRQGLHDKLANTVVHYRPAPDPRPQLPM